MPDKRPIAFAYALERATAALIDLEPEDLDGHVPAERRLVGLVDIGEPAGSDQPEPFQALHLHHDGTCCLIVGVPVAGPSTRVACGGGVRGLVIHPWASCRYA